MPGSTFVLGYDTAIRVLNPKYYEGEAGLVRALSEIREHGCRFVVGGRADEVRPAHTFPGGRGATRVPSESGAWIAPGFSMRFVLFS